MKVLIEESKVSKAVDDKGKNLAKGVEFSNIGTQMGKDGQTFLVPVHLEEVPSPGAKAFTIKAKIAVLQKPGEQDKGKSIEAKDIVLKSGTFKAGGHEFKIVGTMFGGVGKEASYTLMVESPVAITGAVFKTEKGMYGASIKQANGKYMIGVKKTGNLSDQKVSLHLKTQAPKRKTLDIQSVVTLGVGKARKLAH